jgi:phosphoribosyl-ATP pyrophosphohydrolase/phosphoribosyl-AMP cyclohydrolase
MRDRVTPESAGAAAAPLALDLDRLDFARGGGLVTVIAQDARTDAVLMVAHADREALEHTLATGEMHYRSRSRGLWRKGATSGNTQRVASLAADCDGDAVLARVVTAGPACHTGAVSCFDGERSDDDALDALERTIVTRMETAAPEGGHPSYTRRLLADRNLRLKKLGEETAELIVALADEDRERIAEEGADLLYHLLVAVRAEGVGLEDLRRVLAARARG